MIRSVFLSLVACTLPVFALTEEQQKVPVEVDAPDTSMSKIVILAGIPSNKPGQHEYFAGCSLLAKCLKQTPGVWPVLVADGWPKNEAIFNGAKSIVVYMDAGDKLAFLDAARWSVIKKAVEGGTGLVAMHQSVEVPAAQAEEYASWLGGVWKKETGCRGHWDMSFPSLPKHVVTSGCVPFDAPKDGWLFNITLNEKGVTPILVGNVPDKSRSTADAKTHEGRGEVIAWTYERPNGARSFGFSGADLHSSWHIDSQRRMVTNAILWTAKVDVPAAGAPIVLEEVDYTANMDRKTLGVAKPEVTK
jgi:Trehalose utilisation